MAEVKAPEIFSYARNREVCRGAVRNLIDFTEDIRFNACSEISFTVPKYIYNIETEEWLENPVYRYLEEDELLYLCDENEYFKYPVRKPGGSSYYTLDSLTNLTASKARDIDEDLSFNVNNCANHFLMHQETELFDIGSKAGYSFTQFQHIGEAPSNLSTYGNIMDYSARLNTWTSASATTSGLTTYSNHIACSAFIPVSAGDIIAANNSIPSSSSGNAYNSSGTLYNKGRYVGWHWHIDFYTKDDVATMVGSFENSDAPLSSGAVRLNVTDYLPNGGYIRFWSDANESGSTYYNLSGDSSSWSWSAKYQYPAYGLIKIYSGERRCKYIALEDTSGYEYPKMHWFVITSTSELYDGIDRVKTVNAYSYEYTLKNMTISTDEEILPLYIPQPIYRLVNSSSWYTDVYEKSGTPSGYMTSNGAQKIAKGILNYILDEHRGWTLGNISSDLMTTYRSIPSMDDTDLYSVLTTTIQDLYHCFIVFDNDEMTISAYTLKDLISTLNPNANPQTSQGDFLSDDRAIKLTWDNSIKQLTKENKGGHTYNALHVHTGDTTYGIGLYNPHGSNTIYNFTPFMDELEYTPTGASRTLRAAVYEWQTQYNQYINTTLVSYRNYQGRDTGGIGSGTIIDTNLKLVQAETARDLAMSEYRAVVSKINGYLKNELPSISIPDALLSDAPLSPSDVSSRATNLCHSADLKMELLGAAKAYASAAQEYSDAKSNFETRYNYLKNRAQKFTLNPTANVSDAILTPVERRALLNHIKEGVWKDENAVFSDTYSVDDISSTIIEVLNNALNDLRTRLCSIQYDFTIDITNIHAIPMFDQLQRKMYMGLPVYFDIGENDLAQPIMLERHINYKDPTDYSYTFTTDMKRRPLQFRFSDLYSTISQTSVADSEITFDT